MIVVLHLSSVYSQEVQVDTSTTHSQNYQTISDTVPETMTTVEQSTSTLFDTKQREQTEKHISTNPDATPTFQSEQAVGTNSTPILTLMDKKSNS